MAITRLEDMQFATPHGCCDVAYRVLQMLKARGCTVPAWSDGTTYVATPSAGPASAADLDHVQAHFRVKFPAFRGVQREESWQRCADSQKFRISVSPSAGFVGGAPGATRVGTATDQRLMFGSGTDAAPVGADLANAAANAWAGYAWVLDDPDSSISWYAMGLTNANRGDSAFAAHCDVLDPGSCEAADVAPYTYYFGNQAAGVGGPWAGDVEAGFASGCCFAWAMAGLAGEKFGQACFGPNVQRTTGAFTLGNAFTKNTYSAKDGDLLPIHVYVHDVAGGGYYYKGRSKNLRWNGTATNPGHGKLATVSAAGDFAFLSIEVASPWANFVVTGTGAPVGALAYNDWGNYVPPTPAPPAPAPGPTQLGVGGGGIGLGLD